MRTTNKTTARINESQLRRIIRSLIREAPLVDLPDGQAAYVGAPNPSPQDTEDLKRDLGGSPPSASGYSDAPKHADDAKEIFSRKGDNWAVIISPYAMDVLDKRGAPRPHERSEEFLNRIGISNWQKSLGIPKGTKIILSVSRLLPYAEDGIKWTLKHDLIGHSLLEKTKGSLRHFCEQFVKFVIAESDIETGEIADAVRKTEDSVQYFCSAAFLDIEGDYIVDEYIDHFPDLIAAIFFEEIDKEDFLAAAKDHIFSGEDDVFFNITEKDFSDLSSDAQMQFKNNFYQLIKNIIDYLYKYIESWAKNFPVDKPTRIDI